MFQENKFFELNISRIEFEKQKSKYLLIYYKRK